MTIIATALVAVTITGYVGDAFMPRLVDTHPAWLIAFNPRNRNLVLATNQLDLASYYLIGFFRLLLTDPLWFLIGVWYGDAAIAWMERRTRTWGQMLRQGQDWFSRAAYPLIFIAPNNVICLFAGASGMPVRAFFVVNIAGTVARLFLIRQFGSLFDEPLGDLVHWIGENRAWLLPLSILVVVVSIALEARRGETEVASLSRLEDELDETEREMEARSDGEEG
jgi:membrane protein DedA with SNARE-associated domain